MLFRKELYEALLKKCTDSHAKLLVVTKNQPIEALHEAYACGQRDFAESKLQDSIEKKEALPSDCIWHFIGRIQRNKCKKIFSLFDVIHSVDRMEVFNMIAQKKHDKPFFFQVNITNEQTKAGFSVEEIALLVKNNPNHGGSGVMTMAEKNASPEKIQETFRKLKELSAQLHVPHCSMGMSDDYEIALKEGATHIRVGRALFY